MERFRHVIALLLLLAYTGQSLLAVGAPCSMNDRSPTGEIQGLADNPHAGHHMETDDQAGPDDGRCCEGGFCSMSHCQLFAALPAGPVTTGVIDMAGFLPVIPSPFPHHTAMSLYRPPISG